MPRNTVRSLHITVGAVLAVLLIFRISWRFKRGVKMPQAMAGLHALIAIWHHKIVKDDVLKRMWPGLGAGKRKVDTPVK